MAIIKQGSQFTTGEKIASENYVDTKIENIEPYDDSAMIDHIDDKDNPHTVTKEQVGLSNVDNTSDLNKPISTATQEALNEKVDNSRVLTDVPANAKFTDTVYNHPANHPASMIIQSDTHRFVSDTEKNTWNDKQNKLTAGSNIGITGNVISATDTKYNTVTTSTDGLMSSTDKTKLNNISNGATDDSTVNTHIDNKENPHAVTKSQVGLESVSNYGLATQSEARTGTINTKYMTPLRTKESIDNIVNPHTTNNNIHITSAERTTWNAKQNNLGFTPENSANKGKAGGYASLDADAKVPSSQLPSYIDDVVEGASLSDLPATGETGKIYVSLDNNKTYRWSGTKYVEISASLALGTTSSTAYQGDLGEIAYNHSQVKSGNPHNVTKVDVGLGNVDNTSDVNKPISTATQTALDGKVNTSQVLTNVPANAKFTDTVYTHPDSHPASMITESTSKRFVSDTEKSTWNAKQGALTAGANINIAGNVISSTNTTYDVASSSSNGLMASGDKSKLDGISTGANNYTHPSTHPYSMITGTPTSLPANGGHSTSSSHLLGDDTRDNNFGPATYMSGGIRYQGMGGWQTEFKKVTTIDASDVMSGTYCFMQTHTTWNDSSGGYPVQVIYGASSPSWRVGTSSTVWSGWTKFSDGGNAATVNGRTVASNVPSNAKFTDTIYTHPASHPADMITESTTKNFVSTAEKSLWNSKTDDTALNTHKNDKTNPHNVTKTQVGLSNVTNVAQASKSEFDSHDGDSTRHITAAERTAWNAKQGALTAGANITISGNTISSDNTTYSVATTSANGLMDSTDKTKLNGIATGANNYIHPSNHPPSIITQNSTNRFVSDAQISSWDAKPNNLDTIKDQRTGSQMKYWSGTQAQYDAIVTKDSSVSYHITDLKDVIQSQAMVVVNHGTNPNITRPAGALSVYWIGSVEPNAATDNDLWVGG